MSKKVFSTGHHELDPDYKFHSLYAEDGDIKELKPDEGISYDGFNTQSRGWWLTKREAPVPEEYEITESVPYMQGEYDFSVLDQERYYKPRELTYEFMVVDDDYQYRKGEEEIAKRRLVNPEYLPNKLYDTGNPAYFFDKAKVTSLTCDDDSEKGVLTITVKFKAYPYALGRWEEGVEVWDAIDFDDYCNNEEYTYVENKDALIDNRGKPVLCEVYAINDAAIVDSYDNHYTIKAGATQKIVLAHGLNDVIVTKGPVRFKWRCEVMI